MGIKNFSCFRVGSHLVIRNALDALPVDGSYVGWLTEFSFPVWLCKEKAVIKVLSWTTYCSYGKNGWRRIIKNYPHVSTDITCLAYPSNTERVEPDPHLSGTRTDSYRWTLWKKSTYPRIDKAEAFSRKSYYTGAPSFDAATLIAGIKATWSDPDGGHKLYDFLADTEEFGRLLSGPQWLPRTWEEMVEARVTAAAKVGEPITIPDEPNPDETEEDRWR